MIILQIVKTKNPGLLAKLLGLDISSTIAGANTITDRKVTFDKDWFIELLERSKDKAWVTSIVLKSKDGETTYELNTDYTVKVVDNRTIIEKKGSKIVAWQTVLISWSVNQNAAQEVSIKRIQKWKANFSIELFWECQIWENKWKMLTIFADNVTLNSDYILEMKDAFRDGDISWTELSFVLADWWEVKYRDEII